MLYYVLRNPLLHLGSLWYLSEFLIFGTSLLLSFTILSYFSLYLLYSLLLSFTIISLYIIFYYSLLLLYSYFSLYLIYSLLLLYYISYWRNIVSHFLLLHIILTVHTYISLSVSFHFLYQFLTCLVFSNFIFRIQRQLSYAILRNQEM